MIDTVRLLFDDDCYSYTFCLFPQFLNVIFFTFEAVYLFIPSIWIVFAAVLWEGLLGGAAYVNTFYRISAEVSGFLYLKYLASVLLHTAFNYNFKYLLLRSVSAVFILGASVMFCSHSYTTVLHSHVTCDRYYCVFVSSGEILYKVTSSKCLYTQYVHGLFRK
jgi:hypothetical protein